MGNNLGYLNKTSGPWAYFTGSKFRPSADLLLEVTLSVTFTSDSIMSMFLFDPKKSVMRTVFKLREKRSVLLPTVEIHRRFGHTSMNCAMVAAGDKRFCS